MLSIVPTPNSDDEFAQVLPWSRRGTVRSLADVQESSTDDREEFMSRLGVVLQLARKSAGMNQEAAAASLGMSAAAIGRWEAGSNKISGYDLVRLIRLYDFDPDLAVNPPASRLAIRRRLSPVATAARKAVIRALEVPPPEASDESE